jgi:hypothetical protein
MDGRLLQPGKLTFVQQADRPCQARITACTQSVSDIRAQGPWHRAAILPESVGVVKLQRPAGGGPHRRDRAHTFQGAQNNGGGARPPKRFAAELIFPEGEYSRILQAMGVPQGQCAPEMLVRLKHETQTTLSYAALAKRAEFLTFVPRIPGWD